MSEPAQPNCLSAEWCKEQFSKLSAQAQTDVRDVLAILKAKGGPEATKKMRKLGDKREWPHWVLLALRDIIATAHAHKLDL